MCIQKFWCVAIFRFRATYSVSGKRILSFKSHCFLWTAVISIPWVYRKSFVQLLINKCPPTRAEPIRPLRLEVISELQNTNTPNPWSWLSSAGLYLRCAGSRSPHVENNVKTTSATWKYYTDMQCKQHGSVPCREQVQLYPTNSTYFLLFKRAYFLTDCTEKRSNHISFSSCNFLNLTAYLYSRNTDHSTRWCDCFRIIEFATLIYPNIPYLELYSISIL